MRKTLNRISVEGRVYDHALAVKVTGDTSKNPGTTYINGTLDIATDEDILNIVTVHFVYVTELSKNGAKNATFTALKNIIENGKTVISNGKDEATLVKVNNSAISLNDFYSNKSGEEVLVSAKRNQGGWVTILSKLSEKENLKNLFECDMLINGTRRVEADPEKNIEKDYLIVKGAIFDYKNAILPIEFVVRTEGGINFFESLDASPANLNFRKVWGKIKGQTVTEKREETSAFGEAMVKEYTRNLKEYEITGASEFDYEIGDPQTGITVEELKQAMADREVYLSDVKRRQEEYQASKNAVTQPSAFGASTGNVGLSAAAGDFNF